MNKSRKLKKSEVTRVAFTTMGCKLNFTESDLIKRELKDYHLEEVALGEKSDVIVINTCSANDVAQKEFRNVLKDVKSNNPESKIVVIGCYADYDPESIAKIKGVDVVLGNMQRYDLYHHIKNATNYRNQLVVNSSEMDKLINNNLSRNDFTLINPGVGDSCDYYCTYCTLSLFDKKGHLKSSKQILNDLSKIGKSKVREVVLNGFGLNNDVDAEKLLEIAYRVDQLESIDRVRFSSLDFDLISRELIDFIEGSEKFLPYFHIRIQSVLNSILADLGKDYRKKDIEECLNYINKLIPDARIGLDIGLGYKGMGGAQFDKLYSILNDLPFTFLHFYRAPEEYLTLRNTEQLIDQQYKQLKKLSEEKKLTFIRKNMNTLQIVLFGHKRSGNYIYGLTGNYIKVKTQYSPELENKICSAQLTGIDNLGIASCEIKSPLC